MKIIAYDQFNLAQTPEAIANIIIDPAKVKQYYPMAIDTWQVGHQHVICTGFMGSAVIELISTQPYSKRQSEFLDVLSLEISPDALCVETKVYGIFWARKNDCTHSLKAKAFFTMHEDWILESVKNEQTRLLKIWRDVNKKKFKFLPLEQIIRNTAKAEHKHLAKAWN